MLFSLSQCLSLPVQGDYFVSWLTECFASHLPDPLPCEWPEGRKDLMDNLAWPITSLASFCPALPNTFLPKGPQKTTELAVQRHTGFHNGFSLQHVGPVHCHVLGASVSPTYEIYRLRLCHSFVYLLMYRFWCLTSADTQCTWF